jgi:hypothetical protein
MVASATGPEPLLLPQNFDIPAIFKIRAPIAREVCNVDEEAERLKKDSFQGSGLCAESNYFRVKKKYGNKYLQQNVRMAFNQADFGSGKIFKSESQSQGLFRAVVLSKSSWGTRIRGKTFTACCTQFRF